MGGGGAGGGGVGGGGTGGGGDGGGGGGDGGERTDAKLAMGWTLMPSRTNVIQWVILPRGVTFFEIGIGECRRGDLARQPVVDESPSFLIVNGGSDWVPRPARLCVPVGSISQLSCNALSCHARPPCPDIDIAPVTRERVGVRACPVCGVCGVSELRFRCVSCVGVFDI